MVKKEAPYVTDICTPTSDSNFSLLARLISIAVQGSWVLFIILHTVVITGNSVNVHYGASESRYVQWWFLHHARLRSPSSWGCWSLKSHEKEVLAEVAIHLRDVIIIVTQDGA